MGGDGGAASLASAMRLNTALTRLNLAGCGLQPDGLGALLAAVAESKSLRELNLR